MDVELIHELSSQFKVTPREAADELLFVLGADEARVEKLPEPDRQRVYSYFHAMHGAQDASAANADRAETFRRIVVSSWRQFDRVDIRLDSRLTILTGENGTGKTTLLGMLGQSFGEAVQFLGTPVRDTEGFRFRAARRPTGDFEPLGLIEFQSGSSSRVGVREWVGSNQPYFTPELTPYRSVPGLYLDAQRVIGPYQPLESVPPKFKSAREIAQDYRTQLRNLWIPHQMIKPPSLLIKEALVAAAIYGEGNSMLIRDPRALEVWNGFQSVLRTLFPASLEFEGMHVDQGELILDTRSGPFALEAASGGLSAIVTLAWQIYLHAFDSPEAFTVCFDEPENHLHPELQRSIMPALLEAFPTINFVVATHSPFIVTSARDANVYALKRNERGGVVSEPIALGKRALTADQVLDGVLGVDVTLPVWAESELRRILAEFTASPGAVPMKELIARLETAGLQLATPEVSAAIADAVHPADGLTEQ